MKTILLLTSLFTSILFGSCEKALNLPPRVVGQGAIESESRAVSTFLKIESRIGADIRISASGHQQLTIRAQRNLIQHIHTSVINNTLIITNGGKDLITDSTIILEISVPELEEIRLSGAGTVLSAVPVEHIQLSGAGNIRCSGEKEKVSVLLSGFGNIDLLDMQVNEADVRIAGNGNVKMHATERLDIVIPGMGNVYYRGKPSVSQDITGIGNIVNIQ